MRKAGSEMTRKVISFSPASAKAKSRSMAVSEARRAVCGVIARHAARQREEDRGEADRIDRDGERHQRVEQIIEHGGLRGRARTARA